MKNSYIISILILFISSGAMAQIDRTKVPEPGPAPKIELKKPKTFDLDNGIKVMVVENHKLPRVSITLDIDNKPIVEGELAGVSSLLGSMLGNGTTNIPKDKYNDEVDFLGARVSFSSGGAYASSLSKYTDRILELMSDGAMNPLLTQDEFDKVKSRMSDNLKASDKDVETIAQRVSYALAYGKHHPNGEFMSQESLDKITLGDVKRFYETYYKSNNAYLVVIGDVNYDQIKKKIKDTFGKWKKGQMPEYNVPKPNEDLAQTTIDFVNMPNAVQSNLSVINMIEVKMDNPDYFPLLMANQILGGSFNSYLNMNLREAHAYTYGARSSFGNSRYGASIFNAGAAVRNEVTDSSVVETLKEIKRIRNEKVKQEDLDIAKAKYVGNFVMALESPQTIANYALNIEYYNLPDDYYENYLKNINAVTVDDVQRVSKKYFKPENARIVVIGKGSDVLTNLEKTGIPIEYFDKYANEIAKPEFSKEIPAGMNAQKVLQTYIEAVGGKDKLSKINSVFEKADVTIANVPMKLSADIKVMSPNKESIEISAEGMGVVQKQKFNGNTGYSEQQGQKIPLPEDAINVKLKEKAIFPEMHYSPEEVQLESIVPIDGVDTFKISVKLDDQISYRYFNTASGLLVRTEGTIKTNDQELKTISDFGDYKEVEGVMFPHELKVQIGPQNITFKINSVKFNEGVTGEDFN